MATRLCIQITKTFHDVAIANFTITKITVVTGALYSSWSHSGAVGIFMAGVRFAGILLVAAHPLLQKLKSRKTLTVKLPGFIVHTLGAED